MALLLTHPPILWVLDTVSPAVKRPRRKADRLLPPSAQVTHEWSYTDTVPMYFRGMHRGNFTFYWDFYMIKYSRNAGL